MNSKVSLNETIQAVEEHLIGDENEIFSERGYLNKKRFIEMIDANPTSEIISKNLKILSDGLLQTSKMREVLENIPSEQSLDLRIQPLIKRIVFIENHVRSLIQKTESYM